MTSFTLAILWSFKTPSIIITLQPLTVCQANYIAVVFMCSVIQVSSIWVDLNSVVIQLCLHSFRLSLEFVDGILQKKLLEFYQQKLLADRKIFHVKQ